MLAGLSLVAAAALPVRQFHASADGNGLSLEEAVAAARAARSDGPVEVLVGAGTHRISKPLDFSGQSPHKLAVRGPREGGGNITGGVEVTGWRQDAANPWKWTAAAPAGIGQINQLWVGSQRRVPARSATMQYSGIGPAGDTMTYITAKPGQLLASYSNVTAARVVKYEHWTASFHGVKSISGNTLTLSHGVPSRWTADADSGKRYYVENAPEYLASGNGMFYHDEGAGVVHYAPTPGEVQGGAFKSAVVAAKAVELVSTVNATGVELSDVAFMYAAIDWGSCLAGGCSDQSASFLQTAAVRFEHSANVQLTRVTISHTGGYGLWFGKGVTDSACRYCTITDVGAGGVRIGEPRSVEPAGDLAQRVTISDSVIRSGGHVFREGCGVLMQACANTSVVHNDVNDFAYTGISLGWTWNYVPTSNGDNTVGFNHIHTIGRGDLSDMGCVYHLGKDPRTSIVNNVCHNVSSFSYGGWGYYTDQASRFVTIKDNIAYNTKCGGFHQHYGIDNVLENNLFYDVNRENCDAAVRSSAHVSGEGATSSFSFKRNVIAWREGPLYAATSWNGYRNETFANNTYWKYGGSADGTFPCAKTIGNKFCTCTLASFQKRGQDHGSVIADPQLTDPDSGDFTLKPTSPALARGFVQINTTSVGPRPQQ